MAISTTVGYDSVTIDGAKVIEGSLSVSVAEGGIETTQLRYEGGEVAKTKTRITADSKVTIEWKSTSSSSSSEISIVTDNGGSAGPYKGVHQVTVGWDSSWGIVYQHKFVECDIEEEEET